ncbi:MAG: 5'/3'-nucleotidase SurE, partial [Planctomycetota bacterium]|nr:5'/3'-nucleotidase SurE [Planctomycetota bacterium]
FSQYRKGKGAKAWQPLADHLRRTLDLLLVEPPGVGAIWNVNFPAVDELHGETRTVRCPLEPGHLPVRYEVAENRFRYRGVYADRPRRPGSDVDACFSGHIAVTRLRLF